MGSALRYLISKVVQDHIGTMFPAGTMVVNLTGCLLIGLFYGLAERGTLASADIRLLLTVGLCGGFTTFSTFCNENLALLRTDNLLLMAIYAGASVAIGIIAVFGGMQIVKLF